MKEKKALSKKVVKNKKVPNMLLIPIVLLMGFIPLIVHMYEYPANLAQFDWFPNGSDDQADFFFAWKMIAIIIVGIMMIGIMLYRYIKKKEILRFENSFYFLFFYAMFVAMSALFSTHKYWVVRGMHALFEPVWVVFVYILLCYYTYQYVQEEKQVKFVLAGAGIGMTLVTLLGVFQYFKLDFFKTGFGKRLITNPSMWNQLENLNFNTVEGTSYTTLYNPNFLSLYFGMLIPLCVCLLIAARKIWQRVLFVIAGVLCFICIKGSRSDSGWMAIAIGAVILAFVLMSRKKKTFYVALTVVIICGITAVTAGTKTNVGTRIKNTIVGTYHMNERFALREIGTGDDSARLNIRGDELYVAFSIGEDGFIHPMCTDSVGQNIELTMTDSENQTYVINDARFEGVSIQPILLGENQTPAISVIVEGKEWNFIQVDGEGYYYCNPAGKAIKYDGVKTTSVFKEDAMSYRGHIWNMTIPLLGKHLFAGSGANTYMVEYPQDDYIGQVYIYGSNTFQIKAHCWYLQQWVETGLIGTLALLIFIGWYAFKSVRIYRRANLHESMTWVGFGLFAAVLVYSIAGIANDSNVCTAPVFWGMLGLGLAVNRMIAEQNRLFIKEASVAENADNNATAEKAKQDKNNEAVVSKKQTSTKRQSRKKKKNQKK